MTREEAVNTKDDLEARGYNAQIIPIETGKAVSVSLRRLVRLSGSLASNYSSSRSKWWSFHEFCLSRRSRP